MMPALLGMPAMAAMTPSRSIGRSRERRFNSATMSRSMDRRFAHTAWRLSSFRNPARAVTKTNVRENRKAIVMRDVADSAS